MSNEAKKSSAVTVTGTIGHAAQPLADRTARSIAATRFGDGLAFLRGFLARPLEVASVVPSSPLLEARVLQAADHGRARCVVERWPGTGGTTRVLLRGIAPQARLLAVELNLGFCAGLRRPIAAINASLAPGGRFLAYHFRPHVAAFLMPHPGPSHPASDRRNVPPVHVFRWVKAAA